MRSEIILIIIGMALVTFATRFGSVALFRQTGMPSWLERWLRHIPTAILTALIMPALVLPKGQIDLSVGNPYWIAGLVAVLAAYKTKSIMATLLLGMGTILTLRALT